MGRAGTRSRVNTRLLGVDAARAGAKNDRISRPEKRSTLQRAPFTPPRRRLGRLAAALVLALLLGAPASASAADPALVAAYGFDEGSGLTANDASGRNNTGAVSGATWTGTGRFGGALSFDGFDDLVTVADSNSLDLNQMTMEAWVRPTELGKYRAALIKEGATALVYALYSETSRAQPWYQLFLSGETRLRAVTGPTQVPASAWSHLAATYDGLVMRLYVNGTQVATLGRSGTVNVSTGAFRIGGTFLGSEWYKGDIDEVRLYNRALSAAEIQTDMNTAVAGSPDTTPPTTPLNFAAGTAGPTTIPVSWTASNDDRGVDHYRLYLNGQPAGTATSTSFSFTGLSCSTSYTLGVEARDAAGNTSGRATINTAQTAACDTTSPQVALTAPSAGAEVSGTASVAATATDNDAVAGVQFLLDGQPLGTEDTSAPYFMSWNTRTVGNGPHVITARARDRSGNERTSDPVSVTVANSTSAAEGLVVGMGFEEGTGTTAGDVSGLNNHGTIAGATWTPNGRIGSALEFDGVDDMVTIPDADSLDLTNALTLSAWVRPDVLNGKWRTVLFKHRTTNPVYALYAQERDPLPAGEVTIGTSTTPSKLQGTTQLPLSDWSHLAYTYDGSTQRFYFNGNLVASVPRTGSMLASTGNLTIGDNTVWDEQFDGLIDEVRVYNRALPQADIQADMATSVAVPDAESPTAPSNLTATGSMGRVTLNWTAATDNIGVTAYNVHRSATPNFTPSVANRIAQPSSTSYSDSGLVPGTYYYKVTASDRAGNTSGPSNEASGTSTPDTLNPTVSVTAPSNGSTLSGTVNVTANASDNDAVAGVQFLLDGQPLGAEDTTAPYSVSWNTRLGTDGPHVLAARARDASANTATSSNVNVSVDNTAAPPPGLVAGYGFDEGTGTTAADASGNSNAGTVEGATWAGIGHNGGALRFDGLNDVVTVPDSNSLDVARVTVSAWIKPDLIGTAWRTVMFKERTDIKAVSYGIYANTNSLQPAGEISTPTALALKAGTKVPDGVWTHLTMTYDGAVMRLFVDGVQVGSVNRTGNLFVGNGAFRIGGNSIWAGEFFNGLIDEVRVYDRALTQAEVETDMRLGVARDTKAPTVADVSPNSGATGVNPGPTVTATFSEAMDPATITGQTFALRDPNSNVVPATVTYDSTNGKATLKPNAALRYGTQYLVTIEGGASGTRAKDMAGNALASDYQWSFTTEPTPPPILVVDSAANPNDKFSGYISEILRGEGINGFSENDVSLLGPEYLANFDVVVLGGIPITDAQASALAGWVNAGGNLIASRPDKKLAGLLGLTDQGTTLADAWFKVDTSSAPGAGIVGETIQYHSAADRYALNGARAVATLYSDEAIATASPAVSLRDVGTNGGQAAAFAFDIARSIAQTRQGNPAWEGQDRDGITEIRTSDLFYGPMVGDPQPNWVRLSKIHIPYADELQRLLANMITEMNRDRTPVPRFWYLPRGEKAAVVMTGDDHADGGTAGRFNQYKAASPLNCSVANWECVRSTSYVYPASPITNQQALAFQQEGFEVSVHPSDGGCGNFTFEEYDSLYTVRLNSFAASYPSVATPVTSRFHCVSWSDYDSHAKVEVLKGIRLDTNYYHYHESWASFPGFMTGSGMIQRFTDRNGATLNLYQAATQMQDEPSTPQPYPATINALLDNALGTNGYYGMFVANMHTDDVDSDGSDAILASAQARDVPIISSRQALDWVEGRDGSVFKDFAWSGGDLGFTVATAPGANGLQGMLPMQSSAGTLQTVTRDGSAVTPTVRVVKGVQYAVFTAAAGRYQAHYGS
jgi:hypothetical protein